jgi:hypothetical protein
VNAQVSNREKSKRFSSAVERPASYTVSREATFWEIKPPWAKLAPPTGTVVRNGGEIPQFPHTSSSLCD